MTRREFIERAALAAFAWEGTGKNVKVMVADCVALANELEELDGEGDWSEVTTETVVHTLREMDRSLEAIVSELSASRGV